MPCSTRRRSTPRRHPDVDHRAGDDRHHGRHRRRMVVAMYCRCSSSSPSCPAARTDASDAGRAPRVPGRQRPGRVSGLRTLIVAPHRGGHRAPVGLVLAPVRIRRVAGAARQPGRGGRAVGVVPARARLRRASSADRAPARGDLGLLPRSGVGEVGGASSRCFRRGRRHRRPARPRAGGMLTRPEPRWVVTLPVGGRAFAIHRRRCPASRRRRCWHRRLPGVLALAGGPCWASASTSPCRSRAYGAELDRVRVDNDTVLRHLTTACCRWTLRAVSYLNPAAERCWACAALECRGQSVAAHSRTARRCASWCSRHSLATRDAGGAGHVGAWTAAADRNVDQPAAARGALHRPVAVSRPVRGARDGRRAARNETLAESRAVRADRARAAHGLNPISGSVECLQRGAQAEGENPC